MYASLPDEADVLKAPYLIVAFDVPSDVPNAAQILHDVEMSIPWTSPPPLPLGVESVFAMPVSTANMFGKLDDLTNFFVAADALHGGAVRWFVQLCQAADISGG